MLVANKRSQPSWKFATFIPSRGPSPFVSACEGGLSASRALNVKSGDLVNLFRNEMEDGDGRLPDCLPSPAAP